MALAEDLAKKDLDDWFIEAVDRMPRGDAETFQSYLVTVEEVRQLKGTRANCRCHFVTRDAQGNVRLEALARKLVTEVTDYCIPRRRVDEAAEHFARTRSAEHFNALQREAKSLFTDIANSGEAGELLIFLLLERLLGIPQVLCKMSLKTNPAVHYHGVDGVHVKALEGGRLAVYWCESKVYSDFTSATRACLQSIAPFLLDDGLGPTERDLTLLGTKLDLGDPDLEERLVRYFVEDALEVTKREFRGATLVGFAVDEYPDPGDGTEGLPEAVREQVDGWYEAIAERVTSEGVESFEIEVFCLPLPSAERFRDAFREQLRLA